MQEPVAGPGQAGSAAGHLPHYTQASPSHHHQDAPALPGRGRVPDPNRAEQLARALGWFSIGLGLAQLLAPRGMSRAIGAGDRPGVMRAIGARELAVGIGILTQRRPANWLWSRVAGDAMDLMLLGGAARSSDASRRRLGLATAAVTGIAVLDLLSSMENQQRKLHGQGPDASGAIHVEKAITINRTPEECYRMWRDFESFPRFMKHLVSVQYVGDNRLHWKARGPAGTRIEWDAEVTADDPGEYLAWRSLAGADVDNYGSVRFEPAPGGRGTILRVLMGYRPPGGAAGALIARLFGEEPAMQMDEDLRRFKWLMETGEIPTTVGQPSGPRGAWNRFVIRKGAAG